MNGSIGGTVTEATRQALTSYMQGFVASLNADGLAALRACLAEPVPVLSVQALRQLRAGNRVPAVKEVRDFLGCSLKNALAWVREHETELRARPIMEAE